MWSMELIATSSPLATCSRDALATRALSRKCSGVGEMGSATRKTRSIRPEKPEAGQYSWLAREATSRRRQARCQDPSIRAPPASCNALPPCPRTVGRWDVVPVGPDRNSGGAAPISPLATEPPAKAMSRPADQSSQPSVQSKRSAGDSGAKRLRFRRTLVRFCARPAPRRL